MYLFLFFIAVLKAKCRPGEMTVKAIKGEIEGGKNRAEKHGTWKVNQPN